MKRGAEQVITPFLRAAADLNQPPRNLCCCLFQASHQQLARRWRCLPPLI